MTNNFERKLQEHMERQIYGCVTSEPTWFASDCSGQLERFFLLNR